MIFYGWRIVAGSFLILFVIVGFVYYGFPVFYAPLIEEFGWSRAQVTAGFFFSIALIGPAFGISAGLLIDRFGAKRILLAGLSSAGLAFLGFAGMQSLSTYYCFYFLSTVGYLSGGPIPNQVLVSQWFDRLRGRAMGIAYVGIGVGGAVAPVMAQYLIRHYGWRTAMLAVAIIIFALLVPVTIMVVRDRPGDLGLVPDGNRVSDSKSATEPAVPILLRAALRTRSFWLILIASLMSIGSVGGIIQHLQLHLRDQLYTPEQAARVASFLLISSIAGRLVMGVLADRFPKKYVMLAACTMVAVGIPMLCAPAWPWVIYLFAFIFGFGMGADYMLIPLITAECFGVASLGRLMGLILTTDALSQAFAPVIIGRIYDVHRSYLGGFALLAAMAVAGAAAVALIPIPTRAGRSCAARRAGSAG